MLLTVALTGGEVHCIYADASGRKKGSHSQSYSSIGDLTTCLDETIRKAKGAGLSAQGLIPVGVLMPLNESEGESLIEGFVSSNKNKIRVVFRDGFAEAYLRGNGKDMDSDYIFLSSMRGTTELYTRKKGGNTYTSIPDLNVETGRKKLTDHLVAGFAKAGFMLGSDEERTLANQVATKNGAGEFKVTKKTDEVEIQATMKVSQADYENLITDKKTLLNQHLHPKILQSSPNLKEVILLGNYFNNKSFQNYLTTDLQLGNKMSTAGITSVSNLVEKASATSFSGIGEFLKAEEKERQRVEALKARKQAKQARESLIAEIKANCTQPEKMEEYKELYGRKADSLGIPREVVMWNIEEVLDEIQLERELGVSNEIPMVNASKITISEPLKTPAPKPEVKESYSAPKQEPPKPKPVEIPKAKAQPQTPPVKKESVVKSKAPQNKPVESGKPNPKPGASVAAPKVIEVAPKVSGEDLLNQVFKTERTLDKRSFQLRRGKFLNQPGVKLMRLITERDAKNSIKMDSFKKLHAKESGYYEKVSPIHNSPFGKYYFWDALEGEDIDSYVKKNGLKNRAEIDKWSGNDQKLILKIWKEVDSLDFGFDIRPSDILVLSKLTWSLKRDIDVKLVNFTDKEISKKAMEDKMHRLLGEVLGKKTYGNFKRKYTV